jgi:hypothetical protein
MGFDEHKPILCGRCRVPVEILTSSGRETKVHCPTCGHSETLEEARREASQHAAHMVLSNMLSGLRTNDRPELFFHFVEGGDRRPGRRALA